MVVMLRPPRRLRSLRPVRVRKTSSRLGRCRESSWTAMSRRASRSTTAPRAPSSDTGTVRTSRPVDSRRAAGHLGQDPPDVVEPGRVGGPDLEALAADDPLEPVGGVVGDDPAVVDDGDLVGQRVGLLQVLGGEQHGRAVGDQVADDLPHVLALGRVEAGGRLVEEDHRRPADQAGGQVEPAAHAAGVGLRACGRRRRSGRTTRAARRRGPWRRLPDRLSSVPIMTGSACRSGPRRPRRTGRSARRSGGPVGLRDDVEAADGGVAGVGLQQGGEDRGRRWSCRRRSGPSTPRTVPSRAARSTPSRAWVVPKRLRSPRPRMRRSWCTPFVAIGFPADRVPGRSVMFVVDLWSLFGHRCGHKWSGSRVHRATDTTRTAR